MLAVSDNALPGGTSSMLAVSDNALHEIKSRITLYFATMMCHKRNGSSSLGG